MSELIDRQAVLDALSNAVPSLTTPDGCGQFDRELQIVGETFVDAMQIVHALPAASPWHRVEDELPDDTRDVLAVRRYGNDLEKQEVIVAHLSVIMDMKRGFDRWWNATNITHWMPFPEPPKE